MIKKCSKTYDELTRKDYIVKDPDVWKREDPAEQDIPPQRSHSFPRTFLLAISIWNQMQARLLLLGKEKTSSDSMASYYTETVTAMAEWWVEVRTW